jgi:hypothetical protein
MFLRELTDDDVLKHLSTICFEGHVRCARLLQLLIELEDRGLHLVDACPSLYDFCTRRLGMSEQATFRRLAAMKVVRRFPVMLGHIERGEIHMTTLLMLRDHLTDENVGDLVAATTRKTVREVKELLAARSPQPDVPAMIREISPPPEGGPAPIPPPIVDPLSPDRHQLRVTISGATRDTLDRCRDLMRHTNPTGDLETLVAAAFDALLDKLEKQHCGKPANPKPEEVLAKMDVVPAPPAGDKAIPAAVKWAVYVRDGFQCTYVNPRGERCPAKGFLEIDHITGRARGCSNDPVDLRLRCKPHNGADEAALYGAEFRQRKIDEARERAASKKEVGVSATPGAG